MYDYIDNIIECHYPWNLKELETDNNAFFRYLVIYLLCETSFNYGKDVKFKDECPYIMREIYASLMKNEDHTLVWTMIKWTYYRNKIKSKNHKKFIEILKKIDNQGNYINDYEDILLSAFD